MQKPISPKIISFTFAVLLVCFGIVFYIVAWQEPNQPAPEGNVATPLNTGTAPQSKAGRITATEFYDYNDASYYLNPSGQSVFKKISTPFTFNSSGRPSVPENGQFYYDQNDKKFYYYDGTMWMRIEAVPSGTGIPCTSPGQCENGLCVDGYCCDSICNTTCYSCNVPGREGRCTTLTNLAEDTNCSNACVGCSNGICVNWSSGEKDTIGANTCTATHYRCTGTGSCTAPTTSGHVYCNSSEKGLSGHQVCVNHGWTGCLKGALNACYSCQEEWMYGGCDKACSSCSTGDDVVWECYKCYNWVYD